jgi:hypothetical protein
MAPINPRRRPETLLAMERSRAGTLPDALIGRALLALTGLRRATMIGWPARCLLQGSGC